MIVARVGLEQALGVLRQISRKLTREQRLALVREIVQSGPGMPPARLTPPPPAPTPVVTPPPAAVSAPVPTPPPAPVVTPPPASVPELLPAPPNGEREAAAPAPVRTALHFGNAGSASAKSAPAASADDGAEDEGRTKLPWERRLYRLFKPARLQAKTVDASRLAELIKKSVDEVRLK